MKMPGSNISDTNVINAYKQIFKEKGISLKAINIERSGDRQITYIHVVLSGGIHFWIKWKKSTAVAEFISIVNDKKSSTQKVHNPNIESLVSAIIVEYKKLMQRQSFLQQLIALIFDDVSNKNPMK